MIPVHLTVHVLGLTVVSGLAVYALARRERASGAWHALAVGGLLLAVSHVATGALLADELAWPVYVRAAGYAALAVGAAGRLTGTAVVVAVAPPAAHLAAAAAGAMAAFAAARGVLGRGLAVLPLAGGLGLWAAADLFARTHAGAASALSIAGSLAAGFWLLRRAGPSLLARFAIASVTVLLVLVVGLASASGLIFSLDLERDRLETVAALAEERAVQVSEDWPAELRRTAAPLAGSQLTSEFEAVAIGERAGLDDRASTLAELFGVDGVVLVGARGTVVGSWTESTTEPGPMGPGDELTIAGTDAVQRALSGEATGALVVVGDGRVVALGAVPVVPRDEGGEPLRDRSPGVIVLTRAVTAPAYVSEVAAQTGLDASIVVDDEIVASTLPAPAAADVPVASAGDEGARVAELGDATRLLAAAPLRDETGAVVGRIVLTEDDTALVGLEESTTRWLFLLALAGMAVATGLAALAARRTTGPIRRLTEAAELIAEGDLSVRLRGDRQDEVGRLAGAFDDMAVALADRERDLRTAAVTEADLRRRLEVVTGSMGEALIAVDRDGLVTTSNPAAVGLLGDERLVGRPIDDVLAATEETGRPLLAVLGGPEASGPAAARGAVRSGARGPRGVPVSATAAPLRDEGGRILGRVYVLRDISGEVEVERMKTEFLSNISHELRTPLTPIKGYAEVMRVKDVGFERTAEFANSIVLSTQRLERVIGMLVDYASLEAGRMRVTLEPTELGAVVDEVLERWREAHPDRQFVRRLRSDLPEVHVDPGLLGRVLEELIDNATKFSDDTVSVLADLGADRTVELTVRDRGRGIEPEELETILRDFHQADGSATRRFGGLGLGLSIVQRILESFDGDIEVRSEPGDGTDVVVRLPVAVP